MVWDVTVMPAGRLWASHFLISISVGTARFFGSACYSAYLQLIQDRKRSLSSRDESIVILSFPQSSREVLSR
jgi:hypothetical protein